MLIKPRKRRVYLTKEEVAELGEEYFFFIGENDLIFFSEKEVKEIEKKIKLLFQGKEMRRKERVFFKNLWKAKGGKAQIPKKFLGNL